jgi:hypothetical protein
MDGPPTIFMFNAIGASKNLTHDFYIMHDSMYSLVDLTVCSVAGVLQQHTYITYVQVVWYCIHSTSVVCWHKKQ